MKTRDGTSIRKTLLRTFGWVDFEIEVEAQNTIEGLRNGRRPEQWLDTHEPTVADAGGAKSKAVESPSFVKAHDPADIDTGTKTKAMEPPNPVKLYGPADVDTSDKAKAAASPSLIETYEDPDTDAGDEGKAAESLTLVATHRGTKADTLEEDEAAVTPKRTVA
ncbi:MAG: hypothetical protein Q9175_007188 [Cornicularia normoerica]